MARIAKIETPTIDAVINLAYAIMGDKLDEGRTAEKMGFTHNTTVDDIIRLCNWIEHRLTLLHFIGKDAEQKARFRIFPP